MSKVVNGEIKCTNCGETIEIKIYQSVNSLLDNDLAQKLINDELTKVTCKCGYGHRLIYPILYNKMGLGNTVMVQYTQERKEVVEKQFNSIESMFGSTGLSKAKIEVFNDWDEFIRRVKELELNE